jgi:hypothetical protein
MQPISQFEAWKLIQEGNAGYYAITANPPIPHEHSMVVCSCGKFYLATTEEIKVQQVGPTHIIGLDGKRLPKMVFKVEIDDGSELCKLLKKEAEAAKDIDIGEGIVAKYAGHAGRPEQNN